jgi:hypothetical protein
MKIAAWSLSRAMPLRSSRRLKYAEEPRWMVSDIIAYPDKIQNCTDVVWWTLGQSPCRNCRSFEAKCQVGRIWTELYFRKFNKT